MNIQELIASEIVGMGYSEERVITTGKVETTPLLAVQAALALPYFFSRAGEVGGRFVLGYTTQKDNEGIYKCVISPQYRLENDDLEERDSRVSSIETEGSQVIEWWWGKGEDGKPEIQMNNISDGIYWETEELREQYERHLLSVYEGGHRA